jgi:hypothetical protein
MRPSSKTQADASCECVPVPFSPSIIIAEPPTPYRFSRSKAEYVTSSIYEIIRPAGTVAHVRSRGSGDAEDGIRQCHRIAVSIQGLRAVRAGA